MTAHTQLKSWLILEDCITALQMLEEAVDAPNGGVRVRVLWVAAVTMLRAVGHVLQKVDAADDPDVGRLIIEAWPSWQRAWQFQRSECYRNKTLKVYDFGWDHRVVPIYSAPHRTRKMIPMCATMGSSCPKQVHPATFDASSDPPVYPAMYWKRCG